MARAVVGLGLVVGRLVVDSRPSPEPLRHRRPRPRPRRSRRPVPPPRAIVGMPVLVAVARPGAGRRSRPHAESARDDRDGLGGEADLLAGDSVGEHRDRRRRRDAEHAEGDRGAVASRRLMPANRRKGRVRSRQSRPPPACRRRAAASPRRRLARSAVGQARRAARPAGQGRDDRQAEAGPGRRGEAVPRKKRSKARSRSSSPSGPPAFGTRSAAPSAGAPQSISTAEPRGRVLDRVLDQVVEDQRQVRARRGDRRARRRRRRSSSWPLSSAGSRQRDGRGARCGAELGRPRSAVLLAGGEREQVRDAPPKAARSRARPRPGPPRRRRAGLAGGRLEPQPQPGQRGAQLVGGVGHEGALGLEYRAEPVRHLVEASAPPRPARWSRPRAPARSGRRRPCGGRPRPAREAGARASRPGSRRRRGPGPGRALRSRPAPPRPGAPRR